MNTEISDADIIIRNPNHFGVTRQFKKVGDYAYSRIKEAGTGKELWRRRCANPYMASRTIDYSADAFESIDEFIESYQ